MDRHRWIANPWIDDSMHRFNDDTFFEDNTIRPHFEQMDPEIDEFGLSDGELPISSSDFTDWTNSYTLCTSSATQFSTKRCSLKSAEKSNYPFMLRKFENTMWCPDGKFKRERWFPDVFKAACKDLMLSDTNVRPPQNNSVTFESEIDSTIPELDLDVNCCTFADCDNKRMYTTYMNPSDVLPIYPPMLPVKSEVKSAIQTGSAYQMRGTIADGETVTRDGNRTPDSDYISDYLTSPPLSNSSQASSSGDYIDVEGFENSQVAEHNYSITRSCPQKSQSVPTSLTEPLVSLSKSRCNSHAVLSIRTQQSHAQHGRKQKKEMSFKPTGQRGKGRGRPNSKRVSDLEDSDKRQSHNLMERTRRTAMTVKYKVLRTNIPEISPTASKVLILNRAIEHIQELKNSDEELQGELSFLQEEHERLKAKLNSAINNRSFKLNYRR